MEKKQTILLLLALLGIMTVYSQKDSVIVLDEVVLSDTKFLHFSKGVKVRVISDSVQQKTASSLTDLLRANSTIYFKENGYGMVSSASFRGTNAQQTAVVWNGITINSQLTGQTDFNTIIPENYDHVVVRSGGGSVQYGSGAVGGSILLNDSFRFNEDWKSKFSLGYGSFNSSQLAYNTTYGSDKLSFNFGVNRKASDNDYKYLGTDKRNENGAYEVININGNAGYFINRNKMLKIFHNTFIGDRDFSGTLTAPADENYKDVNSRSLLELSSFNEYKVVRIKAGHLYERYRYFPNKDRNEFSYGEANTFLAKYDYKYQWNKLSLNGIVDLASIKAKGSSLEKASRNSVSGIILLSHDLSDKFSYGVNLRQEVVSDFKSPFLVALSSNYSLSNNYALQLNASKNHRVPTFNDLYWVGAGASGNLEVLPETSWQVDLGQSYDKENYSFSANMYAIKSNNSIQWRPNDQGIWMAMNVQEVSQYGLELGLDYSTTWEHHKLLWQNEYAFTKSLDNATNNQLLYVPLHTFRTNIAYQYRRIAFFGQFLYNGLVYTTTDESEDLPSYLVSHMGLDYHWPKTSKLKVTMGLKVNNIFNKKYQNVAYRPMPNRNFQLHIITKF